MLNELTFIRESGGYLEFLSLFQCFVNPDADALRKILFMAFKDIEKKWNRPIAGWAFIISQFAIIFEERLKLDR